MEPYSLRPHHGDSVLGKIVAAKRDAVGARAKKAGGVPAMNPAGTTRDFLGAIRAPGISLIAEIKRKSPSGGVLRRGLDALQIAATYDRHAQAISVVTDTPFFGGTLEMLFKVRSSVRLPVLLKDFVISPYQLYEARALGADAVLLMASVLQPDAVAQALPLAKELGLTCLVEVHTPQEIEELAGLPIELYGVNNRNLKTLEIDLENVMRLRPMLPADATVVSESGLYTREDVQRLEGIADGILVGSSLMKSPNIEQALEALGY